MILDKIGFLFYFGQNPFGQWRTDYKHEGTHIDAWVMLHIVNSRLTLFARVCVCVRARSTFLLFCFALHDAESGMPWTLSFVSGKKAHSSCRFTRMRFDRPGGLIAPCSSTPSSSQRPCRLWRGLMVWCLLNRNGSTTRVGIRLYWSSIATLSEASVVDISFCF